MVLTSNRTRELHDALKRRCLYHWIDYPDLEREVAIIRLRAPEASEALARSVAEVVARLRELDLAKRPGPAEAIDWTPGAGGPRRRARSTPGRPTRPSGLRLKNRDDLALVRRIAAGGHLSVSGRPGDPAMALARGLRDAGVPVGTGRLISMTRGAAGGRAGATSTGRPAPR